MCQMLTTFIYSENYHRGNYVSNVDHFHSIIKITTEGTMCQMLTTFIYSENYHRGNYVSNVDHFHSIIKITTTECVCIECVDYYHMVCMYRMC
jgi:hypothetical protein